MQTIQVEERGGQRAAVMADVARPAPPEGDDVVIRVVASSVNGTDLQVLRGAIPRLPGSGPTRLGFDVAGVVIARGPRVTAFDDGDPVIALLGHGGGGQSDEVAVAQRQVAFAPTSVPLEHAAALPLAGLTALQALSHTALHRRSRPRVLVMGAAGGIGAFAVQLAALAGARVTAAATGDRAEFLRDLGADEAVDPRDADPVASSEGWDVVMDAPAVLRFADVAPHLRRHGVMVSTRPLAADSVHAILPRRRGAPRLALVTTRASSGDLARLARLVDSGRLRIPLDGVFPRDDVALAHARVTSGDVRGKVVLSL